MKLSVGEIIDVDITDFDVNGEGVGKYGGLVVFVAGGVPGDRISIHVVELKKGWARGEIIQIVEYSKERIEPICGSFGACGGCRFLNINYETELEYKKKKVNDALKRIGGLDFRIDEIIGMKEPRSYRNKAVYHVSGGLSGTSEGNGAEIGFYSAKSNIIVPADECVMFCEANKRIIAAFREYFKEVGGTCGVKEITVRLSALSGEILIIVASAQRSLPRVGRLASLIEEKITDVNAFGKNGKLKGIVFSAGRGNVKTLWGDSFIVDRIGGYMFKVSAESFFQVNAEMVLYLYERVREYACRSNTGLVIDAYAGVGTLSVFVSAFARQTIGIELSRSAVLDAEENAELNAAPNVRFIQGKAGSVLSALGDEETCPDAVILDPPRSGCCKESIGAIIKLSPCRIVYVSCNPATLARDLKELHKYGYEPLEGACFDMFARSAHVETVVLLSKPKSTSTFEVK